MANELMADVESYISLDFAQRTAPVTAFAKQGDKNSRIIHVQPLMRGVPVSIDSNSQYVANFAAKKPDGHIVYNDSAKINEDGTITVHLTDQTLAAHGNASCCIVLESQADDTVLTSQNFTLIIEYSAGAYKNLASSDEILGIGEKIKSIINSIIPPITEDDANKVLTANEDGTAEWKEPTGGGSVEITEVSSPDEITEDKPDGLYVVPNGESEDENESGDTSGGSGGGLTVVELTTVATTDGAALSDAELALIAEIGMNSFVLKVKYLEGESTLPLAISMACVDMGATNSDYTGWYMYSGTYFQEGVLYNVVLTFMGAMAQVQGKRYILTVEEG